jgi:hypothetical protein
LKATYLELFLLVWWSLMGDTLRRNDG